uniref:Uncharacterized protein n=1 Tax=Anopheles coluzzii TaxID=1518534 RepID=A0A8W7PH32_ANOCL
MAITIHIVHIYSENCCVSTPPPVLASTLKPAFSSRVSTWMELSLQYPFSGNRITCRPSNWFQAAPVRASRIAWFVSGNTSSRTARSAEISMRSPRSGEMCSATTSWLAVSVCTVPLHLLRLPPPNGGIPFPLRCRSFFSSSICLIIAIVPPTSMCTGAVYLDAAATHGMPVICLWFAWWYPLPTPVTAGETAGIGGVGVGDDEFEMVGDVVGEVLILICVAVNRRVADRSRGSSGFTSRSAARSRDLPQVRSAPAMHGLWDQQLAKPIRS